MTGREGPVNPDNFTTVMDHMVDGPTLDIGSGLAHPHADGEDDVTVDADPNTDPDVALKLDDHLPFDDGEFANVTAIHILEHLPGDGDTAIWEEMKRVASERAIAVVPIGERDDPDHERVYWPEDASSTFEPDIGDVSGHECGMRDYVAVADV